MANRLARRSVLAQLVVMAIAACSSSSGPPAPSPLGSLLMSVPTSVKSGVVFSVMVTAEDSSGHVASGYTGTVLFTSTDPAALLPSNYSFVSADAGNHTFSVTLLTVGSHSLTVTDVARSSISTTQVVPVALAKPLYVSNSGANTVTAYTTVGNVAPTATLSGSNTRLHIPTGIAVDTGGAVYVANLSTDTIIVFGAGATGNAAPTGTIVDTSTGAGSSQGFAFGATGRLYVADGGIINGGAITAYAAGARGTAAPVVWIEGPNTRLSEGNDVALDAAGRIYVVNRYSFSITVYAAAATGNVAPTDSIVGGNTGLSVPEGICIDAAGRIYVTNEFANSVTLYAAGATGNATPVATIAGSNTQLNNPYGVALDAAGTIYVANYSGNTITVYARGATGNVAPIATIAGSNTGLLGPSFLSF